MKWGYRSLPDERADVIAVRGGERIVADCAMHYAPLIAAAPVLADTLRAMVLRHDQHAAEVEPGFSCGCQDCREALAALAPIDGVKP